MIKYNELINIKNDDELDQLLLMRRSPMNNVKIDEVLNELTLHLSTNVIFALCAYPKKDALHKDQIHAKDIYQTNLLQADNDKYLPVFTDLNKLKQWCKQLDNNEFIYLASKQDLLNFLNVNQSVSEVVINPLLTI